MLLAMAIVSLLSPFGSMVILVVMAAELASEPIGSFVLVISGSGWTGPMF